MKTLKTKNNVLYRLEMTDHAVTNSKTMRSIHKCVKGKLRRQGSVESTGSLSCDMDRSTLRPWVDCLNAGGRNDAGVVAET
jgi:hypothetical protein